MTTARQRRRGSTTDHASFTGLLAELTVDTTKKVVVVHDGTTAGGFPLARADQTQPLDADLTALASAFTAASSSGPASLALAEDTDNGSNKGTIQAPSSLTADRTYTMPDASGIVDVLPSGTKMLFVQTSAPTGWTKDTDQNDKALRIVSGTPSTGGATAFSSVFGSGKATGSTTLTNSNLPSTAAVVGAGTISNLAVNAGSAANVPQGSSGGWTGGGATGHTHTLSLDLQYVDVIKATKD